MRKGVLLGIVCFGLGVILSWGLHQFFTQGDRRIETPPLSAKMPCSDTNASFSSQSSDPMVAKQALSSTAPSIDVLQAEADAEDTMIRKAYDKARVLLEAVLVQTKDPDKRMPVGLQLYECLVRTYEYEKALALGQELLTLSPSPEERLKLNQQLAALLHRMGRSAEAEELLNKAITLEQDATVRSKYEAQVRSIWRHTDGRTAEVVSSLNAQIKANLQDEKALRELGQIYLKSRRDYEAAMPVYEQLAALKPDDPEVQGALLNIYRETHNFDKIKAVYESRLRQSAEDDPALRFQIAVTDLQAGRGDEAVAYAEEHLSGDNATPFQLQMLSSLYDKAGRKEKALNTLSMAIDRSTDAQQKVSMQFQMADMLIWNKQYAEAETLLRIICDENKDDKQTVSRVNSELIRIYQVQGKMGALRL